MQRTSMLAAALFLQSAVPSSALTDRQAIVLKDAVLQGSMSALTIPCGIVDTDRGSYQRLAPDDRPTCYLALWIIVDDFEERGYMGRTICPAPGTLYNEMLDAIINHIVAKRPISTERAVDVALFALMRKYPCQRTARPQ
jgi:hypothetical protein